MAKLVDKMVVGINKSVTSIGANSKALVEKAKVNNSIGTLENECSKLFQLLGQKVFELHKSNSDISADSGVSNFFSEITQRNEQIAEYREQLKRIEEEARRAIETVPLTGASAGAVGDVCACGYANPAGYKFCAKCGIPAPEPTLARTDGNGCVCGYANQPNSKFCSKCGAPL